MYYKGTAHIAPTQSLIYMQKSKAKDFRIFTFNALFT